MKQTKPTGKLRLRESSIRIKTKPGLGAIGRSRLRKSIITHWRLMQLAIIRDLQQSEGA